jgi:putative nucleotidyltransferase with HDIG domain
VLTHQDTHPVEGVTTQVRPAVGPTPGSFTQYAGSAGRDRSIQPGSLQPGSLDLATTDVVPGRFWAAEYVTATAQALATRLLSELPNRLAHSRFAARQARLVAFTVRPEDRELLVAAAYLHDIGYAPELCASGFHQLDGARHLAARGAPPRLVALVAHHTEALPLAIAAGLGAAYAEFPAEASPVTDALIYGDMTAGPTGLPMTVSDRLQDIVARHSNDPPEMRGARLARTPRILEATDRVSRRVIARYGLTVS